MTQESKRSREMMTTTDLANRWSMSEYTLRKWRMRGVGPIYIRIGKGLIRYRVEDVEAYEDSRESGVS
jgi:hypothetical protein